MYTSTSGPLHAVLVVVEMDRGSVTQWISDARLGREDAAQQLWDRYSSRLVRLARKVISGANLAIADEQDVANDALGAFLLQIRDGDFDQLDDRDGLWKLLADITIKKANSLVRNELRQKRDARKTINENDLSRPLADLKPGSEQNPEAALLIAEAINVFLSELADGQLQQIVIAKMEGHTNAEIARQIGYSVPTVERRLKVIRAIGDGVAKENS